MDYNPPGHDLAIILIAAHNESKEAHTVKTKSLPVAQTDPKRGITPQIRPTSITDLSHHALALGVLFRVS